MNKSKEAAYNIDLFSGEEEGKMRQLRNKANKGTKLGGSNSSFSNCHSGSPSSDEVEENDSEM